MISRGAALPLMVIILLAGYGLGAIQLNADILWVDEMHSVSAFGAADPPHSISQIVEGLATRTAEHPPLYFVLGAGWAAVAGWSQVALRYLSLLLGALCIAWVFRLGADLLNWRSALLAAFLAATNALILIYFHELRNYTLWLLLSLVHLWLYWRLAQGRRVSRLGWLAFAASAIALLYTHIFSAFVLFGIGAHHLLLGAKNRRWLLISAAWGLSLLTFLPWLWLPAANFATAADLDQLRAKTDATAALIPMLAQVATNGLTWLWLPLLGLCGWALRRRRSLAREMLPLVTITLAMLLAIFAFHEFTPVLSSRRLRYFLAPLCLALLLCAHLVMSTPGWPWLMPLLALAWLAGGWHIYQQAEHWQYAGHRSLLAEHPPLHRYAEALMPYARPQDALLSFEPTGFLNSGLHYGFSTIDYYSRTLLGVHGAFILSSLQADELREDFDRRVGNHPYLLFIYEPLNAPANFAAVQALLERDYAACDVLVDTDEVFAQRYIIHTLACDRDHREIRYDNGITIMEAFADYDAKRESLRLTTGWQVADKALLEQFNVSLQVLTPDWEKVLQAPDRHLSDNILPWYVVELDAATLPPGDYRAMVIVYDRYSGDRLAGFDAGADEQNDIFAILRITVAD